MTLNFHINYDTATTFRLIITKMDPIEYHKEVVVGEFYDISLQEVNYYLLNAERILG